MAFFLRFKAIFFIGIVLGVALFFVVKILLPFILPQPDRMIGIPGRFTTSELPDQILEMIGDGLTTLDESGNPKPNLAISWETPDKGKTWTFILNDKRSWQDGRQVTASSISYEFSDVAIERPNEKTITFKLQNPYSAFPAVVSKPVFKKGLLGTGEWTVNDLSLAGSFVDQIKLVNQNKDEVIYKFYPTEERTKIAFQLGQVSEIQNIVTLSPFDSWKKINKEQIINKGQLVAILFNTQDKILSEKNLRLALSYATDKKALSSDRAISPISADSWAYNSQVKPYDFDLEKAKTLISDYKKASKIDKLELTLTVAPILLAQGEKIKENWGAAGVDVSIKVGSGIPESYQAFLVILDIPEDPDQYSLWHSTQIEAGTNITKYSDPRVDKLLETGRSELDLETRRKTYFDFQRYLLEDSPAAFLYYPSFYTINR